MILKINNTNIVPYIAYGGFKYLLSDIDAPDSGRTMDATMHRGRVASKVRLDITCRPLTSAEVRVVLNAISPEWVTVQYTDPTTGSTTTKKMYSNNRTANYLINHREKGDLWTVDTFPLIEE